MEFYLFWCSLSFLYLWVCCLTFTWGEILSYHFLKYFCYSISLFSHSDITITCMLHAFCSCPIILGYNVLFCFSLSSFAFQYSIWKISVAVSSGLRDSFLSCVQSMNNPIKSILHFCYSVYLAFLWDSFLEVPSLSLHDPFFACCLLLPLEPLHTNHSFLKVLDLVCLCHIWVWLQWLL